MTLHLLYCIFSPGEMGKNRELIIPGIEGEPVHEICSNEISAVISTLSKPPDTDVKTLLAYHGIIDSYHQNRTILPMRFAAVFRTYAHMITALNNNEKSYLLQLKRLHGCTEMCVRFISTSPHEGPVEKKNRYCPPKKYLAQRFFNIEKRFMNSKTACRLKFMKKQGSLSSISGELTLNLNRRGTLWERSTPLCLYKGQIKPMAMNC